MKKPALKQLKNRIKSCLSDHKLAGWKIEKIQGKIKLSKMRNGSYETHTMTVREYADRFAW